jgi:cytochrome P450
LRKLNPETAMMVSDIKIGYPKRIQKAREDFEAGIRKDRATVFFAIFESDLPESEKVSRRLVSEAAALVGAGTETTAGVLGILTFYLLSKPEILAQLRAELKTVVDDPRSIPNWAALEQLPYLGAVIVEALRLSMGVSVRIPRNAPDEDLVYRGTWTPLNTQNPVDVEYIIPRGTDIGMSSSIMNLDERVFPNAEEFIPSRWLDENGKRRKDLDRYLFSFGKGSRQCLGMK